MTSPILSRVISSIAKATRYPVELLTAGADLENDLGIDSVKRLEIIIALGDEFNLRLEVEQRDPSIRTIENIADWIDGLTRDERTATEVREYRDQPIVATPHDFAAARNGHRSQIHTAASQVHLAASQAASSPHFDHAAASATIPSTKSLLGRVALVTGSGRGVGSVIARVLALRGASVIVNSFHSRDQGEQTVADIKAKGGSAVHFWGSVANPQQVDHIFSQIEDQFGRLDILVCNASDGRIGPFMELTLEDWDRAFRTNVTGHHQCAVKAAPLMRSNGGGSIITMSAVGSDGFIDGLGSQGVVKAALETLTRYLACELGQYGIRVNCVVGGPVYGELLSKFPNARAAQNHWESITPDGQLCSPMDLANAIAFLVSDEARGVNGSVWKVDHGFSAMADGRSIRFTTKEPMKAFH